MRKLSIVILAALMFLAGELAWSYRGRYSPPATSPPALGQLQLPSYPVAPAPPAQVAKRSGFLLVDTTHFNWFFQGELEPLLNSVAQRGYQVDFFGDNLALKFLSAFERQTLLETALRRADTYVVILPFFSFSEGEIKLVQDFVARGGRLLLVGDPTRSNQINSLAAAFGINFELDYLYNVREHEGNFRHVFFRDFAQDDLTSGLGPVVLYTASSISGAGRPLVFADAATQSSMREAAENLTPMVRHPTSQVIAISDFTFMLSPYNSVANNQRLIDNLADFLTTSTRRFNLTDFPFFFKSGVDIVMTGNQVLNQATQIKQLLSTPEREPQLVELERPHLDTVFVGLYHDLDLVQPLLRAGGIDITQATVQTPFTPPMAREGSGLLYLDIRNGRHVLVALADTLRNLGALVQQLQSGDFRAGLVAPNLGLYRLP